MEKFIKKYFRYLSFFYNYLGYRVFLLIILSLFVGLLDGFGLALFIPVFQLAADGANGTQGESLGDLQFLLDWIELLGFGLTLNVVLVCMVLLFVLKSVLKFCDGYYKTTLQMLFVKKLRYEMVDGLGGIGYKEFVKQDAGKIQNTLSGEVFKVSYSFLTYFSTIQFVVLLTVYIVLAMLSNFQFALLVSFGGFLSNFLFKMIFRFTEKASVGVTELSHIFQSYLMQAVQNFKYLKATDYFSMYKLKLKGIVDQIETQQKKIGIYNAIIGSAREPIILAVVVAVIIIQVNFLGGAISTILLSLMFFYRALNYVISLQTSWQGFISHYGGVVAAIGIIDDFNKNQENFEDTKPIPFINKITLENVSFSYSSNSPVLKNIFLEIEPKKTFAFVGGSGSGKTTLVNLLVGLLDPSEGSISIDGIERGRLNLYNYRKRFGYITQEPVIFNDTVFNNVTFWAQPTEENIAKFQKALRMAHLDGFVENLPFGNESKLGDNGHLISGGQKQRISIAREMYKDVDILIFDEATSALDSETERAIQDNIEALMGKFTMVIVAHRLSTVRKADEILILENGSIIGQGDFETLVNENLQFKKMVELQEF